MVLKDLLELMDDDEEITVTISFEDAEDKDKPTYVTGPVWAMPWRFIKREIKSVSEYYDKILIVVKGK